MGAPQIIVLALMFIGLGIELQRDGQPKKGVHSFGVHFVAVALHLLLLWWGGFFV